MNKKIQIGKPPSQMKGNHWYERKGPMMKFDSMIKDFPKQRAVSYFTISYRSHGGAKYNIQYWKTLSNGFMIYVDIANMKMGIVQGLTPNRIISGCTKREFDSNFNKMVKMLSVN